MGITWGPYRCCGDDGVDVGMTGTMWGPWRQHGDHRLGGWVGVYGAVETMWDDGDNGDYVGMMGIQKSTCFCSCEPPCEKFS